MRGSASRRPSCRGARRGVHARTWLAVTALLAWGVLFAGGAAHAQAVGRLIGALQGGEGSDRPVPEEATGRAVETARRSFEHAAREAADRILGSSEGDGLPRSVVEQRIEAQVDAYLARSRERLVEAQGDGALSWSELSQALAEQREESLDALIEQLHAAADGADPPPDRTGSSSWLAWAAAITRYTVVERNGPWRWAACLGLLVGGLVIAGLAARGLVRAASRLDGRGARRTARAADSLSGPFYLAASVLAVRAALDWVWLPVEMTEAARLSAAVLIALSLLWVAWRAADGAAGFVAWAAARTRGRLDEEVVDLVRKGLRIAALAVFTAFAANMLLGIELGSILATVGVIGIVVSIAAQDTLRNMMGAFTVYGDRPFVVGDLVRFRDWLGTVEEIGFRSTRVRSLDGHRLVVPNAELVREPVENLSARPWVRHNYSIDLVYETPPDRLERALEILEEILTQTEHPEQQPPHVSFEAFGAYSLRLELWYHSDTSDYWEARAHRTEINRTILERFNEEGLEFAFPTRTVELMERGHAPASEGEAEPEES